MVWKCDVYCLNLKYVEGHMLELFVAIPVSPLVPRRSKVPKFCILAHVALAYLGENISLSERC